MPLHDRLVLELDAFNRTAAFEFRDHSPSRELTHSYLVGGSGQVLSELYSQASDVDPTDILPDADTDRRAGIYLDAGAGTNAFTITAEVGTGDEDLQWGDGSSAAGSANKYDAAGETNPGAKRDVLLRYLQEARTDSGGQLRLYIGEWSDGTYASSAGVFGKPIPVALVSVRAERPKDESATVTYTLEFEQATVAPTSVDELTQDFTDAANEAVDQLKDTIADWT